MSQQPAEDDDLTRIEPEREQAAPGAGGAPAWIGPYRLIELLGSGGMGEVYLAEQTEPVERKLAIKLIRQQQRESLGRALFEVERALLARMQHPYVAQVLDAGETDSGRPWFAMEWVPGEPIVSYCSRHNLDRSARLGLFLRVCQGVQHAHQRGILHRDLKPANILVSSVDGRHWPKIIDFGIATSLQQGTLPEKAVTTDRAGTLAYMSPEQLAGDPSSLDTRTDVYALGILLFELLTGLRPLVENSAVAVSSFCEVLQTRQATTAVTAEPRFSREAAMAARALPIDLRWIVARAIAPQRERRYTSAAALAEDINRYLNQLPVEAVPASTTYRLAKFVRRNRLPVAAGSLMALALVAGLGMATWGLTQARAERDRAQVEAARAMQMVDFVRHMFESIDPVMAEGYDIALLRRVLDDAADRAVVELDGQPQVLSDLQYTFGLAYRAIGEWQAARQQFSAAVELSRLADLDEAYLATSIALAISEHHFDENEAALLRIDEVLTRLDGSPAAAPRLRLAALTTQAFALQHLQRLQEAEATFRQVIGMTEGASEADLVSERLDALRGLAQVHSDRFEFDQAVEVYQQALSEGRAWEDPRATNVLLSLFNDLAVTYLRRQQYAEAEPLLREALERGAALYGPEHPSLLNLTSNLAGSLRQQGRAEEALPLYLSARDRAHRLHDADHPSVLAADFNLGNGLRDVGRVDEALVLHRAVLDTALRLSSDNRFLIGLYRLGLGRSALAAGYAQEAHEALSLALVDLEATAGPDFHRTLEAREHLALATAALAGAAGEAAP